MPNQIDHAARYSSAQACAAAGITQATLLNWVSRKPAAILLSAKERELGGKGRPLQFSFNRVLQIALVAELVDSGIQPRPAGMIAAGFTDLSSTYGHGGWEGDAPNPTPRRMPGQLFPTGLTLLVGYRDRDSGCVLNLTPDAKLEDLINPPGLSAIPAQQSAGVFIVVNPIYNRVLQSLEQTAGAPVAKVLA